MKHEESEEARATYPADLGITSTELMQATRSLDSAELNLSCSDLACHIAINEFELVFLATI